MVDRKAILNFFIHVRNYVRDCYILYTYIEIISIDLQSSAVADNFECEYFEKKLFENGDF